jgi:hypothetical protein
MARLVLLALLPLVSGFGFSSRRAGGRAPVAPRAAARSIRMESFGFEFAENPNENSDPRILGEFKYKTKFVKSYKPKALVLTGEPYPLFKSTQEKRLLSATADAGLLTQLDDLGFTLSDIEKILPVLDKVGALRIAGQNLPFLLNIIGYLVVEPGQIAIPGIAAALKVPAPFYAAAGAGIAGYDAYANALGINPKLLGIGLLPYLTALSLPVAFLLMGLGGVLQFGPGWASDGEPAFASEPASTPELNEPSGGLKLPELPELKLPF